MSHGNLEGKIVTFDFWTTCENCRFFAACKRQPRHPAYPHSWHWGREFAVFTDGYLITRSWVGTDAIGHAHTSCKSYEVNPAYVSEPQRHHHRYLVLAHERRTLEAEMAVIERRKTWNRHDEEVHASLFTRYRQILAEQDALRSVVPAEQSLAVAVNE